MEILQLRYFYETAMAESIAKTAQKYMVPASSVSASIKRLEQELGVELFVRTSNRISLSEKGKLLYDVKIQDGEISYLFTENYISESNLVIESNKLD